MRKKTINLITPKEADTYTVRRLKASLPIIATISLMIFIGLFILSVVYVNKNAGSYISLKNKVVAAEKEIENQKDKEGIYTITTTLLDITKRLLSSKKDHYSIYSKIATLTGEGITITAVSIDGKGKVFLSANLVNYEQLPEFINNLRQLELTLKKFTQIRVDSAARDKKGIWSITISMMIDEKS